jgi:alpha-tubulin suppressor-like RCC1 family protein
VLFAVAFVLASTTLAGGTQPRDTYETTIAADSPVAQYRFEDASESATLADSAGSNTATNHGVALGGAGPFDGSVSGLFGGEAYASLSSDPLESASEFTAEGWVNWSGEGSYDQPIFDFGSSASNYVYLTPAASPGSHDLTLELHTSEGASAQVTAPKLGEGAWHYVAATESGAGELKLYVDGAEVGHTDEATVDPASLGSIPTGYLGKSLGTAPDFKGRLSNVVFYVKALSTSAIKVHYGAAEFPVNTTTPMISGTAEDEQSLTAHAETWTGLEPVEFGYQWLQCNAAGEGCSALEGGGEQDYVAGHGDVEHTLRVEVTGTNAAGHGTARSAPTATIAPREPSSTSPPTISGTLEDGQTLSASTGLWSGTPTFAYAYQWQRCDGSGESCADISGATSSTYAATFDDVGHRLRAVVTATNAGGSDEAASSASAFVAPTPLTELGYASEFGEEGSGDGQFKEPFDVAIGAEGDIFVLDRGNDRVEKFDEAGESLGQFGEEGSGDGQLRSPVALAVDGKGHVWIADSGNERLEEFDEHGDFTRTAGEGLIGDAEGIAIDHTGHVWVSATYAGHLAVFGEDGEPLEDVGTHGSEPGQLGEPEGIAVDPDGHVLVADYTNSRVEEFDEAGEYLSEFGSEGAAAGRLSGPYAVAIDAGHVFLSEWGHDRVQEFDEESGTFIAQLGASGSEAGQLGSPTGLALDPAHELLIADSANDRIQRWSPEAPGASASVSSPSIYGTPGISDTYEASVGVWRGSRRTYAFQWQRCDEHGEECVDIEGETSASYTVVSGDVGVTVRVLVTATNSLGSASTASAASELIGEPPVNTSSPTIPGTPEEGVELTVDPGEWERASGYGYEWQRCNGLGEECVDVERYWEETYMPSEEDVGHTLRVIVTAWNGAGEAQATSLTSATVQSAQSPTNSELPTILGSLNVGKSLSASSGSWEGPSPLSYTYQWQDCGHSGASCTDIAGAESSTYRIPSSELADTLRAVITATNSAGSTSATSATSTPVEAGAPVDIEAPTVSGATEDGQTLTATSGSWAGSEPITYAYQWQRCESSGEGCSDIPGVTSASYTAGHSDVALRLRVLVTATNGVGPASTPSSATAEVAASPPESTAVPTISGTAREGQMLSASTGSWTGTPTISYAYEWQRCDGSGEGCSDIAGATSATYAIGLGAEGETLRVVVTASNAGGSVSATSSATIAVGPPAPPSNTAAPTISGVANDGQTLIANLGSWEGAAPMSYVYQWQSCDALGRECQNIEGASKSSYVVATPDLGATLRVLVTATNLAGSAATASSTTESVGAGAPSELSAPSILGEANVGETLSGDPGVWGGTEAAISYQWERCNAAGEECAQIPGAIAPEYAPSESDVGDPLRLRIGASNTFASVTAVSLPTQSVAGSDTLINTWAPSVEGTSQAGHTLTANSGSWLGSSRIASFTYIWENCDNTGANCERTEDQTDTYALSGVDVGMRLRVTIIATEGLGEGTQTSQLTPPIAAEGAPISEGTPTVSGSEIVGSTLTASTGEWAGEEATLTYGYQWERCDEDGTSCSAISGATSQTYTLVEGDAESTLRVAITATRDGTSTSATSAASARIGPSSLVDVSAPTILGADLFGRALQADPGVWTVAGAITYAFKWERCNESGGSCTTISGATEGAYTPTEADVGHTLAVTVTGSATAGSEAISSAPTAIIVSAPIAPEEVLEPSIEGAATTGQTLTANPGSWLSTEAISYSYQWQRCDTEGEECVDIAEATSSAYTPPEEDAGGTLRVMVSAENSLGSIAATSSATETIGTPGPPAVVEAPGIIGTAKVGERLVASDGSWSGTRPMNFYYAWERCNNAGEACAVIGGATDPGYTVVSGDLGGTLRVRVSSSNTLGAAAAESPQAIVSPAGEATTTSAIETAQEVDPSALAPSTAESLEGKEVEPAITDSGEQISSASALTSSSTSKETPGEFAVDTPAGQLSFAPTETSPTATKTPTIVNGTAAVFAETAEETDTIVRPDALGAATLLELHSSSAPTAFSWEVSLGPNQRLEELSDGSVAVVEVPSTSPLEGSLGEGIESPEPSEAEAEAEGSGSDGGAAEGALEEGVSEASGLEHLPAAPTASTLEVAPKSGELHPQETKVQYERATGALASAEEHVTGSLLMVVEPPDVLDAVGHSVTSSLHVVGDTVTLDMSPTEGTEYPVTAEVAADGPSDTASSARGSYVRYGLSDPNPGTFEQAEEGGKLEAHFDSHLASGPLHVGIARDVIPYNWHPNNPALIAWLTATGKAGLKPYLTFTVEPGHFCLPHKSCVEPTIESYEVHVTELISGLMRLHASEPSVIPAVTLWGAWNEPDFTTREKQDPLRGNPKRAALFWKRARAILRHVGCSCTMVAGEFAEDDGYITEYEKTILTNHSYWPGKPHVWGLHDYHDLVNFPHHPHNSDAEAFLKKLGGRLGSPRVWLSEQGVELQDGEAPTDLYGNPKGQREAARDFLSLHNVHLAKEASRIEVVDYYLYHGPEANTQHKFDSGMLTASEKEPKGWRQSYCVLALGQSQGCPAKAATGTVLPGTTTAAAATALITIDPAELPTIYQIEYGASTSYGHTTTSTYTTTEAGEQSETVRLAELEACTTYHYQAVAENEANAGTPSLGGDQTFKTACLSEAKEVSVGTSASCAALVDGHVACWGDNENGLLGNGTRTEPESCFVEGFYYGCSTVPIEVADIDKAVAVAVGNEAACALLSTGHIECWGVNVVGEVGNGTISPQLTPVSVSGITDATAISAGSTGTCALLETGKVKCWGKEEILGNGPYDVDSASGSATPVTVPGITTAVQISVGDDNDACATLEDGHVECWGNDDSGQVGDGSTETKLTPVPLAGVSDAAMVSTGNEEVPADSPGQYYNLGNTCVVRATGEVKCLGANIHGALGDGTYEESYTLQPVTGVTDAVSVSTDFGSTCALLADEDVKCWGFSSGANVPHLVESLDGAAVQLSVGIERKCVVLYDGNVACWGYNRHGGLGDGSTTDSGFPVLVSEIG